MDDERLYTVDNSAIVGAFDLKTGAKLWEKSLGTLQKGSPVLADGKLYVGTENGKFYILRPSATGVEVLDEDLLGTAQTPEPIVASPIVADGRVYVDVDGRDLRDRQARAATARCTACTTVHRVHPVHTGAPARRAGVSVRSRCCRPARRVAFKARLFDAKGNFIREEPRGAVVGRSVERRGRCEGRLRRRGAGLERGIREGDRRRPQRHGARARDRAAAVGV